MARYPSGISSALPNPIGDTEVWLAHVLVAIDEQPLGTSAPCANPECSGPVDYLGTGAAPLYCSTSCRARASALRGRAEQQLMTIEQLLDETRYRHGVPRERLRARANLLRWWLARLGTRSDRLIEDDRDEANAQGDHHQGDRES